MPEFTFFWGQFWGGLGETAESRTDAGFWVDLRRD